MAASQVDASAVSSTVDNSARDEQKWIETHDSGVRYTGVMWWSLGARSSDRDAACFMLNAST